MKTETPPIFDEAFQSLFADLLAWRRDVRRFRNEPVQGALIEHLLDLAQLAPSVGNSQPWRWVAVENPQNRLAIRENFTKCNAEALATFAGERAHLYASLKLEGLDMAPLHYGVFCDHATAQGEGLGCRTMPHMLDASVSGMITTFWLAARAAGLGVGWVSILDPELVRRQLGLPEAWQLIAYLCIGWPREEHVDPELVRFNWQARTGAGRLVTQC